MMCYVCRLGITVFQTRAECTPAAFVLPVLLCLCECAAVHMHFCCGSVPLCSYQPVFVYSGPLTVMAASLLTLAGLAFESRSLFGAPGQRHGAFGWMLSRHYAPVVVYLGTIPGVVGHQGFNTVLK
jgi:hypothetical protein